MSQQSHCLTEGVVSTEQRSLFDPTCDLARDWVICTHQGKKAARRRRR
jgi:hypothetical protein